MKHTQDNSPPKGLWKKWRIIVMTMAMYSLLFGSHFLLLYLDRSLGISYNVYSFAAKILTIQYLLAAVTAAFLFYIAHRPPASRRLRLLEFLVFLVPGVILCTPTPQYLLLPGSFTFMGIWDPSICLHDSAFIYLGGSIIAGGIIRFITQKPAAS